MLKNSNQEIKIMRFSKINRIIKNPEIFGLYIKTRNKRAVKHYLSIKETRNLMLKACDHLKLRSFQYTECIRAAYMVELYLLSIT